VEYRLRGHKLYCLEIQSVIVQKMYKNIHGCQKNVPFMALTISIHHIMNVNITIKHGLSKYQRTFQ